MKLNQQQAFTIIELMITLVIVGIVVSLAAPGMGEFIKNERLTSYRNTLFTDLFLARSKAVERNQPTIVCVSTNEASCTAGAFESGWIVGIDTDNDGTLTNADELIKVQQSIQGDIQFNSNLGSLVIFDSRGFNPGATGLISVCDDRGNDSALVISISVTGRISRGDNPSC
jgi:type IV fimbrial biogenesis protein FimT